MELKVELREGQRVVEAVIRDVTTEDKRLLVRTWCPVLDAGPNEWLDRDWTWSALDTPDDLACSVEPRWLVLSSLDAREIFGVLVVSGPVALNELVPGEVDVRYLWIEYLAIAPRRRDKCPDEFRLPKIKPIGPALTKAAIGVSRERGAGGRIGLHAEGSGAQLTYDRWKMRRLATAGTHPSDNASYPVYVGDESWADEFFGAGS